MKDLDLLVYQLKSADNQYAKISNALQGIYWVFIAVFSVKTFVIFIQSRNMHDLFAGVCFILCFLIFALFFRKYYKMYNQVDYALPTIMMLKQAAYRYQPFQLRTLWIILAVALMDCGYAMDSATSSDIQFQLLFLCSMAIATCIGLIIWYFKYKPLRDNALCLIAEIEGL